VGNIIIGGDLNFTIGRNEVWDLHDREDKLENYFIDHLESVGWVDLDQSRLSPPSLTIGSKMRLF
jgi:hypothetical protein